MKRNLMAVTNYLLTSIKKLIDIFPHMLKGVFFLFFQEIR